MPTTSRHTPAPCANGEQRRSRRHLVDQLLADGVRSRSRSLAELNRRLRPKGPRLEEMVEAMLARGTELSILEIGFGWGRVLVELAWRFRTRPVALAGINLERRPPLECADDLAAVAEVFGVVPAPELGEVRWPDLYFYDATTLQLPDASADLIYSAVCIRFIPDKARVIEEVARVLRPGGTALLEIDQKHWEYPGGRATDPELMSDVASRMVVHHALELVPLDEYLAWAGRDRFAIRVPKGRHCVIEITKLADGALDLGLQLDNQRTIPTHRLSPSARRAKGIRTVYAISPAAHQEYAAAR